MCSYYFYLIYWFGWTLRSRKSLWSDSQSCILCHKINNSGGGFWPYRAYVSFFKVPLDYKKQHWIAWLASFPKLVSIPKLNFASVEPWGSNFKFSFFLNLQLEAIKWKCFYSTDFLTLLLQWIFPGVAALRIMHMKTKNQVPKPFSFFK